MADVLTRGDKLFLPSLVVDSMLQLTKGKSSLAKLSGQSPIAFNGTREFTFTLDKEIDLVAENGAKTKGGATVEAVTIVPVKVEYGARISDEFMYASEEQRLPILQAFAEGFATKLARGFDIMAMHGVNPRTQDAAASTIGQNHFDAKVDQKVQFADATADENVEAAIALVHGSDFDVTGFAMSPELRSALAKQKYTDGTKIFPELAWGSAPATINGLRVDVNNTVNFKDVDRGILGDFEGSFKWGIAKEIPIEVIQYGNPDNDASLGDLKGHNQVYLRGEAYIGWGILNPKAFARITKDA